MTKRKVLLLSLFVLLVCGGYFFYISIYQKTEASPAPLHTVTVFMEKAKQGEMAKELLSGPMQARSQLVDGKVPAIDSYKIIPQQQYESYAVFEVWTRKDRSLSSYRYHVVNEGSTDWKISFIETINPSWPAQNDNNADISIQHRDLIQSFITKVSVGEDVRPLLANPLRLTINGNPPAIPTLKPTVPDLTKIAGDNNDALIRAAYTVDKKKVIVLFHVLTLDGVTNIAEVVSIQ